VFAKLLRARFARAADAHRAHFAVRSELNYSLFADDRDRGAAARSRHDCERLRRGNL